MFNKEESNNTKKVKLDRKNYKRMGNILLTMTLVLMLAESYQVNSLGNQKEVIDYKRRIYDYQQERQYDINITKIYNEYQINIDGVITPIEKFYILYDNLCRELHLMNVKSEYSDILTNSKEEYQYDNVVKFRDTTAFINLINSDAVIVDDKNKMIIILDKEKANDIVKNWDGQIHDKVAETDAILKKDMFGR